MSKYFTISVTISILFLLTQCETKQNINENKIIQGKKFGDSVYNQTPMVLWYMQPALQSDTSPYANGNSTHIHGNPDNKGWDEALPIGNGRLMAMVFGGIKRERIQLNEESLWSGKKIDFNNPDSPKDLAEIRKLIFDGKHQEAQLMAEQKLTGLSQNISSYKPLADIFLDFTDIKSENEASHYYRDLHIDSALATVHYEVNGKLYTREIFASNPNNIIVMRLTCNWPNSINTVISMTRETDAETFRSPFDSTLLIQRGKLSDNGLLFETQLKAAHVGGTVDNETRKLICKNVDTLTLYISAATSFNQPQHALYAKQQIINAIAKPYNTLKTNHIADYKSLFDKVQFNLTSADKAYDVPTDQRIERILNGKNDKYLTELMFQYGRYLLISSSRKGNLPINMQGKWNEHLNPNFGSGYRIEWTLPLVYSAADVTNLSELEEPLLRFIDSSAIYGSEVAKKMYNLNGWTAHDYLSIFGNNYPTTHQLESIPPLGAAWLMCAIYDSYLFNGDKEMLKSKIYPLMKGASTFLLEYLITAPNGPFKDKLVVCPSLSEENEFELQDGSKIKLSYGSALDQQLVYDLFINTINAIDQLSEKNIKYDPAFRLKLSDAISKLALAPINPKTGEIQEWLEDYETSRTPKNYISQLYGLYPSSQISRNLDPKNTKAAEQCLINEIPKMNKSSHGYALAAIWWARLGKPDEALNYLNEQITESTSPNLLSNNPPFYIDGNMIYTSAVAEMLIQSHENIIEFLPAEPATLGEGYVKGLMARGAFQCDIEWGSGKIFVNLLSKKGNLCKIKCANEPSISINDKEVKYTKEGKDIYTFETEPNKNYQITYQGGFKSSKTSKSGKDMLGLGLGIDLGIKF